MQRAFDTVVETKLDLLRGFTLDERAARLREQNRLLQVNFQHLSYFAVGTLSISINIAFLDKEKEGWKRTVCRIKRGLSIRAVVALFGRWLEQMVLWKTGPFL